MGATDFFEYLLGYTHVGIENNEIKNTPADALFLGEAKLRI